MFAKVQTFTPTRRGYSVFAGIPEEEAAWETLSSPSRKPAISVRPYRLVLLCACKDDVGQSPV